MDTVDSVQDKLCTVAHRANGEGHVTSLFMSLARAAQNTRHCSFPHGVSAVINGKEIVLDNKQAVLRNGRQMNCDFRLRQFSPGASASALSVQLIKFQTNDRPQLR